MWDEVVGELVGEFLYCRLFALGEFGVLFHELVHACGSRSAGSLIGGNVYAAYRGDVVEGLECHHHNGGGAVGVGYHAARRVECIVAVDFGHHQGHVGVHAEG